MVPELGGDLPWLDMLSELHGLARTPLECRLETPDEEDEMASADGESDEELDADAIFRDACAAGDHEAVAALIGHGADVDGQEADSGASGLHLAAWRGHAVALSLVLEAHANIHVSDKRGLTPLHLAAQMGHMACVGQLIQRGASSGCLCALGMTPLQLAIENGMADAAHLMYDQLSAAKGKAVPSSVVPFKQALAVLDESVPVRELWAPNATHRGGQMTAVIRGRASI